MRLQRLLSIAALAILVPAAAFAEFNQTSIITASMGGLVSGTYRYFNCVSAISGLAPPPANWPTSPMSMSAAK